MGTEICSKQGYVARERDYRIESSSTAAVMEESMESYGSVAGLDVHKKSVVVVVLQSDQPGEDQATGIFGTTRFGLNELMPLLRNPTTCPKGQLSKEVAVG